MAAVTSRENSLCKICNTYLIFGQPLALAFLVHVLEAAKKTSNALTAVPRHKVIKS